MSKIAYIFFTLLITVSAVLPSNALVVCQKEDGSVIIEFMNGELCACDHKRISDEQDKNCCIEAECHDDVEVTAECHDKKEINSGSCKDTELEFTEILNSAKRLDCDLLPNQSSYADINLFSPVSIRALIKPFDVGKNYLTNKDIFNHSLLLKKTTVFII